MTQPRKVQLWWGTAGLVGVLAAGALQELRPTQSDLAEIIPGRAFLVNYLWIRADQLKEEGRFYDAMQLAEMICRLQKRYPGVWQFHAWNMAWNISVATHTPEERWRWVYNGLRLLRDQAIPLNRKSIGLYKDLGWIYLFKIGNYLDDAHWVYKRQLAVRMQDLLGAPPDGNSAEIAAAFGPIADAPLDKTLDRQGRSVIQADMRARLLKDPQVAAYAAVLAEAGVGVDQGLLGAYNQFSEDEAVRVVRVRPPEARSDRARAVYKAVNHPDHAAARAKILAFVRAQVLWNVHRLDPDWMAKMMARYGPLDWRLPQSHGLYWVTYGLHVCENRALGDIDSLNTQRNALNCLKELTWRGRLTLVDARPRDPDADVLALEPLRSESEMQLPRLTMYQLPDIRFVEPTHAEFERAIRKILRGRMRGFKNNTLRTGHINYLVAAVKLLYVSYRHAEAQRYLDYIYENYEPKGKEWRYRDVDRFVQYELAQEAEPIRDLAENLIGSALSTSLVALARGRDDIHAETAQLAAKVHAVYMRDRPERMQLPPLEDYVRIVSAQLLANPRALGHNLSLTERSALYERLGTVFGPRGPAIRRDVYDKLHKHLRAQCEREGIDFEKAFPPPAGWKEKDEQQAKPLDVEP